MRLLFFFVGILFFSCKDTEGDKQPSFYKVKAPTAAAYFVLDTSFTHADSLALAALALTQDEVSYDGRYFNIQYPNGDIPEGLGVCTDVVIRAYRKLGIDLQKEVHEDMQANFSSYPQKWGLHKTDTNIDHRRVPNLMTFFKRHGVKKSITKDPNNYLPGDIVCWMLSGNLTHIGIVVNQKSSDKKRYMIVHNIGGGQVLADCLFDFRIIGHYAY